MLCTHLVPDSMTIMAQKVGLFKGLMNERPVKKEPEKETIHSGHFMVSDFEAEAQDDGDDLAVPLPEEEEEVAKAVDTRIGNLAQTTLKPKKRTSKWLRQPLSIETSLTKLFQCMSLAYRQKLTSPKWNRFKGIRLRWKDKIRLNNVIWRCWHMQFIGKKNSLGCQFASPLDVDTHNKPEAVVLEGKYWKRKLSAVTAEYKKWRMYYRNQALGQPKDALDSLVELDCMDWPLNKPSTMVEDVDYMEFMTDTLFSTISLNQPFAFPDTREIARGAGIADFIQPSLVQLQPNLDDFMDTLEPLQDLLQAKLGPVVEETGGGEEAVGAGNKEVGRGVAEEYGWVLPDPPKTQPQEAFILPKMKGKGRGRKPKPIAAAPVLAAAPVSSNPQQPPGSALLAHLLTNNSGGAGYVSAGVETGAVPLLPDSSQYQRTIFSTRDVFPQHSEAVKGPAHFEGAKRVGPLPLGALAASQVAPPPPLPLGLSSSSCLTSPDSPETLSYSSQPSPSSSCTSPTSSTRGYHSEHRRVCHINAEQKRRCNIKNGFDTLHSLIPQLSQNPNTKMSKAVMLEKGADYIRQLRNERNLLKQEIEGLRAQIETISASISNCQSMLPATGAPVSKARSSKMMDMFHEYVRQRTHQDWKFWILSLMVEPLLSSFNATVSTDSLEDLYSSTLHWVDHHCTLLDLRPVVLNSLRQLSVSTDVLTDPGRLPLEARAAVDRKLINSKYPEL